MTAAHVYVEAKQWEDARLLLAEALKIKPNSIAAQDLFMIVEQNLGRVHLRQQEAMFVDAMHAERWSDAVALAAGLDASSTFALKMDIQRSKSLAELEQAINGLLGAPSQLGRPSAQAEVNRITLLTESLDLGERLTTKYEQLIDAKRQWSAPVVVVLRSDNQTTVSLRPGRALGQFREKTVELMPGEYQLIGRRNGFREVRHALSLKPGQATQTYVIEASDRF